MQRSLLPLALWLFLHGCSAPALEDPWGAPAESARPAPAPQALASGLTAGLDDRSGNLRLEVEDTTAPALPAAERQVIYTAGIRLLVVSAREAAARVQRIARERGGYLQESDARSVTVRVPAKEFEPALAAFASLGEELERNVRAADVTEQVLDLEIRLDNARRARERLLAHLEKSEKIEDTLKIETELARVSAEIELLEGRLRHFASQIAMSTIRVELETSTPQQAGDPDAFAIPFDWVARLGDGLVAGAVESQPRKPRFLSWGPSLDLPGDFLRYYSSKELVEAMSADGLRIKVQRHDNHDKGALAFWSKLARRTLERARGIVIATDRDAGGDRAVLSGTREVSGQPQGYLLVLTRTPKHIHVFEAWGPQQLFAPRAADLERSGLSLRP